MSQNKRPMLLICDMQTKFRSVIEGFDKIEASICCLAEIFRILSLPMAVTTQSKAKLGDTVPSITASLAAEAPSFDKTRFSMAIPEMLASIRQENPTEVVIVGIETQICVSQTALDLKDQGYHITILADAVSSSSDWERDTALTRLQSRGINITSIESWVYETMQDSTHPQFREISKLLRQRKQPRHELGKARL